MMGVPMLVGYYWRGNEEAGMDRTGAFDGLDPFTF